jgi:hypothetical protein
MTFNIAGIRFWVLGSGFWFLVFGFWDFGAAEGGGAASPWGVWIIKLGPGLFLRNEKLPISVGATLIL